MIKFRKIVILASCSTLFWMMLSWQFDWLSLDLSQNNSCYIVLCYVFVAITFLHVVGLVFYWIVYIRRKRKRVMIISQQNKYQFIGLWDADGINEGTGSISHGMSEGNTRKNYPEIAWDNESKV